ncbi:hypothetical protein ACHZ97_04130 [Lysobacter soli]
MSGTFLAVVVYSALCLGFCLGFIVSSVFRGTDKDDEPFPTDWRR